jgi:PIN domain nuclease of toxin-antitoxin system
MRLLPDSHTLIWWLEDSRRLSAPARDLLNDGNNPFIFSAAVAWEVRMKQAIGKLETVESYEIIEETDALFLPMTHAHAEAAAQLPLHHRDPFDRMLIAQAQIEDAVIVTADAAFAAYDVRTVW